MRLISPDGSELKLSIVGYESASIDGIGGDEWLEIQILVRHPRGTWETTGPFLRTVEVGALATWFDAVAAEAPMINRETFRESGHPLPAGFPNLRLFDSMEFMEPNLRLTLMERTDEYAIIRVYFELEARPSWAHASGAGREDLWVDLRASAVDLRSASQSLRAQLSTFPDRASP